MNFKQREVNGYGVSGIAELTDEYEQPLRNRRNES